MLLAAKPLSELKLDDLKVDTDHVDCKSTVDIIDECGLQQGYSHRYREFNYPTNQTFLMSSCKRQADAFKCLRAYAKCLQPLSKQVLLAMVASRQKYNKKICTEKQSDAAVKLIELNQCLLGNKASQDKAIEAEINSVLVPEAIVGSKIDSVQDRLKHSCCSVAKVRKEFLDASTLNCKQHIQTATDLIDSYLAETVGIICPDPDSKKNQECDKLPKLAMPKSASARYFVRPILNVIQTLA